MSEYTNGPWQCKGDGVYGADGYGIAYPIAQAIVKLGTDEQSHHWMERNAEANARLIAAAPELLEALEELLAETWINGAFADKARAAIAKAKGEQP